MSKVVFISLRNRKLNKFKSVKAKKTSNMKITKVPKSNSIKKTLNVKLGFIATGQNLVKPASPVSKASPVKIGKDTMNAIIGHRRVFLRNRRLMNIVQRPMISAF